jgi:hypothetical protein
MVGTLRFAHPMYINLFSTLPNPQVVMCVYPHLARLGSTSTLAIELELASNLEFSVMSATNNGAGAANFDRGQAFKGAETTSIYSLILFRSAALYKAVL